jgi:general secretion pathway protein A
MFMYKKYFGLTDVPFSIAPDPRYLYLSDQHREALAHLLYGVRCDGGFVLLTGEVGTGKTTVCRCFLEQLPDDCDVAYILNPRLTVRELLSTICDELGIKYPASAKSIKLFVDLINFFLLHSHAKGRKALLVIDEAQNLSVAVLEQIRLLTNLETYQRKLLQVILLGQPELKDLLARPNMRQLAQRIVARYHLGPLNKGEVAAYVDHRLSVAGMRSNVFPASTLAELHRLSGGIPRLINVLCDRALLGAYVQSREEVDRKLLIEAAKQVFGATNARRRQSRVHGWLSPALAVLILVVIGGALLKLGLVPGLTLRSTHSQREAVVSALVRKPIVARPSGVTGAAGDDAQPRGDQVDSTSGHLETGRMSASTAPQEERGSSAPADRTNREVAAEPLPAQSEATVREGLPVTARYDSASPGEGDTPGEGHIEHHAMPVSSLKWPDDLPLSNSETLASQSLFALWGLQYKPGHDARACDQASALGLRCLFGNGGLDDLRNYNRPSVLKLFDNEGVAFYATLKSFDGEKATFLFGTEQRVVPISEIALHWHGDYVLLWRPPPHYNGRIRRGDGGATVAWLYTRLARLRGVEAEAPKDVKFDKAMQLDVKKFQTSAGLKPDGIVGPQTLIRLETETETDSPLLTTGKADKG